ncbi:unnamed protein product [Sphagnum compactum]
MSHLPYEAMASPKTRTVFSHYAIALWRILRLALFFSCLLFSILVSLGYGINQNSTGPIASKSDRNIMKPFSPLQSLLNKESDAETQLSEADCIMMQTITEQATLELKTLVIAETIVPHTDKGRLLDYVKQQLDASNVLTDAQKQAVLTMVELAPMEASIHKEEIGERGTLRNSAVLALITQHLSNIHFMLIGVRAEPRLGWKWIPVLERNAWNDVLSRVLSDKVRIEAKNYLWHREVSTSHGPKPIPVVTMTATPKTIAGVFPTREEAQDSHATEDFS